MTPPRSCRRLTLGELVSAQAARTPDAPAVVCGDVTWSYAELDAASGRIAAYLAGLGAGPEQVVAIAVPRSAEMVAAVLGVAKTGAAYLPVDPDYPAERISFMLADARPALILCTTATAALLGQVTGGGAPACGRWCWMTRPPRRPSRRAHRRPGCAGERG